jgi:hypothetical protein
VQSANQMASTDSAIDKLKGTWDYVDGESFDVYLQEVGESVKSSTGIYLTKSFIVTI